MKNTNCTKVLKDLGFKSGENNTFVTSEISIGLSDDNEYIKTINTNKYAPATTPKGNPVPQPVAMSSSLYKQLRPFLKSDTKIDYYVVI